jgi:hypothetical protein
MGILVILVTAGSWVSGIAALFACGMVLARRRAVAGTLARLASGLGIATTLIAAATILAPGPGMMGVIAAAAVGDALEPRQKAVVLAEAFSRLYNGAAVAFIASLLGGLGWFVSSRTSGEPR